MVLGVKLAGLVAVVLRVAVVGVGDMRVVRGLLVVSFLVRLRGLAMVLGCVFVVLRRLVMMLQLLFV